MKKFFLLILLFIYYKGFSQDTTKVEQYCEVVEIFKGIYGESITINYGEEKSKITDQPQKYNSPIETLNNLGKQGWKLVSVLANRQRNGYRYILKKEFPGSAIN